MKKTISVNLANRNFYIEEDAFNVLDQYINGVREYYKDDDPEGEIAGDFEMRMGEIFQEKMRLGHEVITLEITKEVIKQLGRIEDFDEPEVSSGSQKTVGSSAASSNWSRTTDSFSEKLEKKLYRDPKKKILGGVVAGLAINFNADVALLRFIFLLLLFTPIAWLVIIMYLAGWIFLPEASTVSDRLKMEGKPLNSETLWHTISEDNPEMSRGEEKAEVQQKPKKSNAVWWIVSVLLVLGIIAMLVWGVSSLTNGMMFNPDYWTNFEFMDGTMWELMLGVLLLIFIVIFIIMLVVGVIALIYILPIVLILRSSLSPIAKALIIILWLTLTGGWTLFVL